MPSPLSSRIACAGLACAGALALSPAAGAATLKLPSPAAGEVAITAAPVTGTLKVGKAGVPKGVAITGGVVSAGGKKLALVAVVRPKKAAKPSAKATAAKLGTATTGGAVLATAPTSALTTAVAPACSSVAATLGRTLRRGTGAPTASDLKTLGKVLAARLCGSDVDAKGRALLGLLGLNPAAAKQAPSVPLPSGVVGATSKAPAPPAPAPPVPPGGITPPPSPGDGAPACANGKDDDGDGQVDALGKGAPLFDPGCSSPTDTTEDSEKPLPAACTDGAVTQGSRVGFAVRVDSRTGAGCPKAMTRGLVDVPSKVTGCNNPGWDDGHGNGASSTKDDVCANDVAGGIRNGDEWHLNGVAAADLCGARAVVVAYAGDGTAWERDAVITDKVAACTTPAPPLGAPECADGIDNDYDGQIDVAGVADSGPDPGCTGAQDASEDEAVYPSTGCWNYVAPDPEDPTIAWVYVMPNSTWGSTCPTMDAAAISFDYLHVKSCLTKPYWAGTEAGTCTVKNGDAWLAGGSGARIAVALQLDEPIGCDTYTLGQVDMRATGTWREAITTSATIVGDHLEECN
ncbi:hypothetical protein [Baekduia sp. Peel2402]|uniref:hypothetical protein n=1 Tax=Baekduia sp. Peel2402 TaxID=3458296 RepID=UPI00403EE7E6